MRSDGGPSGRGRSRWWLVAVAGLVVSLLPMTGAGATEEPAGSDESSSGAAGTPADPDPEDLAGGVEVVRYAGSDPYEMSIELARALVVAGDGSSEWVVLASGESWADAVAAGPLAASLGAPVVLVPLGGLQSTAARPDFVEFLRSAGVRRAVIVGDPETLPNHEPSVLYGLGMLPRNIERVHGSDPVGAAIAMAERIGAAAEFGDLGRTVIIASDQSVADAVAVGPLAAAGPFPLLLTAPDALDPRITAYLTDQEVAHIVMVGGTTAIAPAVQEAIETASITVTRLAGHDRIDTAQLAADLFEQHTADDPTCTDGRTRVGLAPAQQPEQALTAGPLLAQACAPLRFTESDRLPADLRNTLYLSRDVSPGAHLTVFGSGVSVPDSTLDVNTPPVRFAAFNFRPNADADALVGVLEVIDEAGVRRSFPVTEVTLGREWGIPSDWWQRPHNFISYRPKISWSSDGHRLAYWSVDAGALYVLDLRDGELRRIAQVDSQMDGFGSTLNWSPDGSRLAFDAIVEEESTLSDPRLTVNGVSEFTSELFVHDVESGETTRLTHNNFVDSVGPWSPDGTRLSFIRSPASSTWMSPAGLVAYRRLIVLDLTTKESHELHPYVLDTLWSPDGETIAFSAVPNGSFNTVAKSLYLATPDGSQVQQVPGPSCDGCRRYATKFPLPSIHLDGWSPTGDQIAYSALFWADRKGLTRQVASDETSEVFHESEDELFASGRSERLRFIGWRPDGRNLMYLKSNCQRGTENEGVELSVVQVAADGSGSSELLDLMPLLGDSPASCYPTYGLAPGGQSIILVDQSLGLHAVGLEGADFDRLVTPTPRAIEVSYRIHNPCSVEWTHSGVQIGCRYSTGQF